MTGLEILGTGRCLPARAVTNLELSRTVDTSDEWITTRTGIGQRYFCQGDENCTTLAIGAGRQAMAAAGISSSEVGVCLVATFSPQYALPATACLVQSALELPTDIPCFDLNAACSGFLYALETARALLADNPRPYALVIGAEQLSRMLDFEDRTTCVLFGDGGGAVVARLSPHHLYANLLGARGDHAPLWAYGPGCEPGLLQMDGQAVFRFAVEIIPHCIKGILGKTALGLDEVDLVICHQANSRIIDHVVKKLNAPPEQFYKNMSRYGNTSAASIPLALDELMEAGRLTHGTRVICVGFGGGLTWGGTLITF